MTETYRCSRCKEEKPSDAFYKRSSRRGHASRCKSCRKAYQKEHHPRKTYGHCKNFDEMIVRFNEATYCECCGRPFGSEDLFAAMNKKCIDHKDDWIRGIICGSCNTAIGQLGDDIDGLNKALKYLEASSGN